MAFRGQDFLDVAQLLARTCQDEGCRRTAIGRAYYAAFHSARDYCASIGRVVPQNNPHVELRRNLEQLGQIHLADDLRTLHQMRKNADYDVPFPSTNLPETMAAAIGLAESILSRVNQLVI
jgi:hypothetical protein